MSRQRVAITGIRGQLGSALARRISDQFETSGVGSEQIDVTDWPAVRDWIAFFRPNLVIHAAAHTDVDGCERDPESAFLVNGLGTRNVSRAAAGAGATLVYVSTNFVFDGTLDRPYNEFDEPAPISVYGASKLAGEREASYATNDCYVVRTAMVYAREGRNFVNSMLRLFNERDSLDIVNDQYGNPTYADDLAGGILDLIDRAPPGTYHVTNAGSATWYEWADEIRTLTGAAVSLNPIAGSDFKRDARPPENGRIESMFLPRLSIELPHWRDALTRCLET